MAPCPCHLTDTTSNSAAVEMTPLRAFDGAQAMAGLAMDGGRWEMVDRMEQIEEGHNRCDDIMQPD